MDVKAVITSLRDNNTCFGSNQQIIVIINRDLNINKNNCDNHFGYNHAALPYITSYFGRPWINRHSCVCTRACVCARMVVRVSVHVCLRVFSSRYPVPSSGTELVGQARRGSGNHPLGQGCRFVRGVRCTSRPTLITLRPVQHSNSFLTSSKGRERERKRERKGPSKRQRERAVEEGTDCGKKGG